MRRKFRAEDKIQIVLEGLRCEISVSQLCWREYFTDSVLSVVQSVPGHGKERLRICSKRDATEAEILLLREENEALEKALAESMLDVQRLKGKNSRKLLS
jgi:transposase